LIREIDGTDFVGTNLVTTEEKTQSIPTTQSSHCVLYWDVSGPFHQKLQHTYNKCS